MLGDVQTGELNGIVDAYSSQPERIPYFRVSREVDYTTVRFPITTWTLLFIQESFFEADSISIWANLTQHFIFDGLTYLFIAIFLIIFNLIFLLFKLQPLKNLQISRGMTNVFYLLFVTFLFLFYNAEFNAIAIVPTFNISTWDHLLLFIIHSILSNFRTLIDGLQKGQRKIISTSGAYLRAEHVRNHFLSLRWELYLQNRELFGVDNPGSDQLIIEKDVQVIFNKVI